MPINKNNSFHVACAAFACAFLVACGDEEHQSDRGPNDLTLERVSISVVEDSSVTGSLGTASQPVYKLSWFTIVKPPLHGTLTLNPKSGDYRYTPEADFFGEDTFTYRNSLAYKSRAPIEITVDVQNVNDSPELGPIPDTTNSAETRDTIVSLPVVDVDGDVLHVVVTSDDPTVAAVTANDIDRSVTILPNARGSTQVHVTVSDSEFSLSRDFNFTVGDVTKFRTIAARMADGDAIVFTNTTDQTISVTFEHNDFPLFQSDEEILQYVRDMQVQYAGEPFERKLWRFVRDNSYHFVPLSAKQWLQDTWAVVAAQGWGLCSHVSAAYVRLARAAGYEARVWGLTGHVVPEIRINGQWQMFDPDLSLYYFNSDLQIASVTDLADDPNLILAPFNRLLPDSFTWEYSSTVADLYASANDNFIGDGIFLAVTPGRYQPLVLPPGSRLTYPGKWTATVIGVDGTTPHEVPYYLQSELVTPAGWTGQVVLPWMIWEIHGTGRVRILGQEFDVGSPSLRALIQDPGGQIPEIEVLSADSDLSFVSFINAMRYGLNASNTVALKGIDVWGVAVGTRVLTEDQRANPSGAVAFKKPAF